MDCPVQKIKYDKVFIKRSKCVFEIENFLKYEANRKIDSANVQFLEFDAEWTAQIIPNHGINYTTFVFTINLNAASTGQSNKLQYRVVGSTNSKIIFEKNFRNVENGKISDPNSIPQKSLIAFLTKDGSLIITLQVEFQYTTDPTSFEKLHHSEKSKLQLVHQYSSLLSDATFSDFTFIVKGKSFKVHKNILASESETMRAMFTNEFTESASGECRLDDIEPNVFQFMLQFIYAGIIPENIEDVAMDLYKVAHYYRVIKLMKICKEIIHFGLSNSNALEVYELATMYEIEDVRLDAWKIVKSEYFNIFFALNEEPLPLKDFQEIRDLRAKTMELRSKHKKTN